MRFTELLMPCLSYNAIFAHDYRAHQGIGLDIAAAALCQLERPLHPLPIAL